MGMGMMGFRLLMMLLGLFVVIGLVAVAAWALIYFTGAGRPRGASDSQARQILDQRSASGQIDRDEYLRIRRELS